MSSIPKYALKAFNDGKQVKQFFCLNCKNQKWFDVSSSRQALCLKCNQSEWIEEKRTLKPDQKDKLRSEAGGKCANPGCSSERTHIHHIDEWAIYHSDDPNILIPVCPTCHDQIHHGTLKITRKELLSWKKIKRDKIIRNLHVYVEPGEIIKFRAGGLWIAQPTGEMKLQLFKITPYVHLKINVQNRKVSLVDLSISDVFGQQAIEVISNYIRVIDESLLCQSRSGFIKISTKEINKYLPQYLVNRMRKQENQFAKDGLILLELRVLTKGQLSINGCWHDKGKAIIMTNKALTALPSLTSMASANSDCTLIYTGDKTFMSFAK